MKKELYDGLKERRSIRKFKQEQISEKELDMILEAATYGPTAKGAQSPKIVVTQDAATVKMLSEMNAEVLGSAGDPFYGAPTVAIIFADSTFPTYVEDGSLVLGTMLLAAYSLDIGSCWINRARQMFQSEKGKELMKKWGIDEKYIGIGCCIMGYPDGDAPEAKPRKEDYIVKV